MSLTNEDLLAISNIMDKKLDERLQPIHESTAGIKLHLENVTDKNIRILAGDHIELTNKLNQAIPAVNINTAYEVKVNYLIERVSKLEKEISDIKGKIA